MENPECWSEVEEGGKFRYFYWGKGWSKIAGLWGEGVVTMVNLISMFFNAR